MKEQVIYQEGACRFFNKDCMSFMRDMISKDIKYTVTLTDIPYGEVNGEEHFNGLRSYTRQRGLADIETFSLEEWLPLVYDITTDIIIVFCGMGQMSTIFNFFKQKQKNKLGTVRQIVWEKKNACPMNGHNAYLNGIENAVWFKKSGSKKFKHKYRNTVFRYNIISERKIHPTEKNHDLITELILGNSEPGDMVFDPCAGSGTVLECAVKCGRRAVGCEINAEYFDKASTRLIQRNIIKNKNCDIV